MMSQLNDKLFITTRTPLLLLLLLLLLFCFFNLCFLSYKAGSKLWANGFMIVMPLSRQYSQKYVGCSKDDNLLWFRRC